jgi:hypothetical protein
MYALLQLQKRSLSLAASALLKPIPPSVLKCFCWSKYKFRKHHRQNLLLLLLESQISLAAPIQVSRTQTYVKRTFRDVAHWHSLLNELRSQKCQSLGFHSGHRAAKLLPA